MQRLFHERVRLLFKTEIDRIMVEARLRDSDTSERARNHTTLQQVNKILHNTLDLFDLITVESRYLEPPGDTEKVRSNGR